MSRCEIPPRPRRARAVACAALAVFATSVLASRARAEMATGSVYVTTLPSGAEVWIDGVYVGRSPVLADALARGRHAITITKSGWNPRQVSVDVMTSGMTMSSTALDAAPGLGIAGGNVLLRAVPDGARVAIDGKAVDDPSKPIALPAGPHRLTVDGTHGARSTRSFTVIPDTQSVLVLRDPEPATRSKVVGLADDYVPGAYTVEAGKVVVRYDGHLVVGRLGDPSLRIDGATVGYDVPPETIGGKLYLPLELLERLTGGPGEARATTPRIRPTTVPSPSAPPPVGPTLTPSAGPTLTPSAAPGAIPSPAASAAP
jgi:hypothetical protein